HHHRAAHRPLDAAVRFPAAAVSRDPAPGARVPARRLRLHRRARCAAAVGAGRAAAQAVARGPRRSQRRIPRVSRKPRTARVLVVAGTRPEAIKLAPVMEALLARDEVETRLALTGQHTDLVDQVLEVFGLEPSWDLGIMREGQSLYDVAAGCLTELRAVYAE